MNCQSCGAEVRESDSFCPKCGEATVAAEVKKQGMKWHKVNAYFLLPYSAFLCTVVGVLLLPNVLNSLINSIPNTELKFFILDKFYFFGFDIIELLNVVYGFVLMASAAYKIYVSFALIKFKRNAPKLLYINLILGEIVGFLYYIIALILMSGMIDFDAEVAIKLVEEVITTICSLVLWLLVYTKYYNNRKHLFVN